MKKFIKILKKQTAIKCSHFFLIYSIFTFFFFLVYRFRDLRRDDFSLFIFHEGGFGHILSDLHLFQVANPDHDLGCFIFSEFKRHGNPKLIFDFKFIDSLFCGFIPLGGSIRKLHWEAVVIMLSLVCRCSIWSKRSALNAKSYGRVKWIDTNSLEVSAIDNIDSVMMETFFRRCSPKIFLEGLESCGVASQRISVARKRLEASTQFATIYWRNKDDDNRCSKDFVFVQGAVKYLTENGFTCLLIGDHSLVNFSDVITARQLNLLESEFFALATALSSHWVTPAGGAMFGGVLSDARILGYDWAHPDKTLCNALTIMAVGDSIKNDEAVFSSILPKFIDPRISWPESCIGSSDVLPRSGWGKWHNGVTRGLINNE